MVTLKLRIQVTAGLILGQPDPKLSRAWSWTSEDQRALEAGDDAASARYVLIAGESREYAATLENPRAVNWVTREWIWL